ncbi:MAG: hypothetical protein LBB63_03215 [Holosporaceae bacterium]|jgi:hypothetical protein|nr:hypothetical protein [Holosporaceae bacterium]
MPAAQSHRFASRTDEEFEALWHRIAVATLKYAAKNTPKIKIVDDE